MTMRPCMDCGTPTQGTRCPAHQAQKRSVYGPEHQAARRTIATALAAQGTIACGYCPVPILNDGQPWVAAHVVDGTNDHGWMPAHPLCNERAKVRY